MSQDYAYLRVIWKYKRGVYYVHNYHEHLEKLAKSYFFDYILGLFY